MALFEFHNIECLQTSGPLPASTPTRQAPTHLHLPRRTCFVVMFTAARGRAAVLSMRSDATGGQLFRQTQDAVAPCMGVCNRYALGQCWPLLLAVPDCQLVTELSLALDVSDGGHRAGYVSFLFFLAKGLKVAILKQVLRIGVYAMGRTMIQPFHQVQAGWTHVTGS